MAGHADDAELAAFCAVEHPRLVRLLALYVGSVPVAEELAQDSVARLCEHWPRVAAMANRRAWLTRVALNLANSWFRRRAAERRAQARHGPVPDRVDEPGTAAALAVRAAVAALPPRQRTALVLRYYADLPVAEVAALMRCSEGTVKALTHQAIARLRERGGLRDDQEAEHVC